MLAFMDWSIVVMGCLFVLGSLGGLWWAHTRISQRHSSDLHIPSFWAWLPLLMGLGMIGAKVPGLLHASYPVVELLDALNVALAVTVLFFALRSARRYFRARGTM